MVTELASFTSSSMDPSRVRALDSSFVPRHCPSSLLFRKSMANLVLNLRCVPCDCLAFCRQLHTKVGFGKCMLNYLRLIRIRVLASASLTGCIIRTSTRCTCSCLFPQLHELLSRSFASSCFLLLRRLTAISCMLRVCDDILCFDTTGPEAFVWTS